MPLIDALKFLDHLREAPDLTSGLKTEDGIGQLVHLGSQEGFKFGEAELVRAFQHDWAMRWRRASIES